ncbi:DUF2914 domain-containing protein [Reinekea sp.]|jgi:hypothetical protein|uniref:DUF2914 domain-containing protein n=1 Tax=Reinekea sp. TaxID=1970455 RepID=UPI00398A46CF
MKKILITLIALSASIAFAADAEVARHQFASAIENREPVDALTDAMNVSPLFYFTELSNFEGTVVTHRWSFNGNQMADVTFNVGGPRWRVYSSKQLLPEWDGEWVVEVLDEVGSVVATDMINVVID